jgi:hypothetical protein
LRTRDAIAFVTYTTENVTGLDVSSPVRYLGVPVGRVTGIRVGGSLPGDRKAEGFPASDRTRVHTESSLHPVDALDDGNRPGSAARAS